MSTKQTYPSDILDDALARYRDGLDPNLIELPELAAAPLLSVRPATLRKSRTTGILLGCPAPPHIKRGRSVRYRLSDILEWIDNANVFSSTAEAGLADEVSS